MCAHYTNILSIHPPYLYALSDSKAAQLFGVCGLAIAQWLGGASGQEASGSTLN